MSDCLIPAISLILLANGALAQEPPKGASPSARLVVTDEVVFPSATDSNSPAFWRGGLLNVFNSLNHPFLSTGEDVSSLDNPVGVQFVGGVGGPRWMEAILVDSDGTLYGYYHHEPVGVCPGVVKTAPDIGAARSRDGGFTWQDLGLILKARADSLECRSANSYFVGGEGDFSAVLDRDRSYVYFLFSSYTADLGRQGVALARMAWADREAPSGRVFKWDGTSWSSPGLGGTLQPLYPAQASWHEVDADAFWGPSVHWNRALGRYVMLVSRAADSIEWTTEGIYVAYADRLDTPAAWSQPQKLYPGGAWYPQVMGLEANQGTDSEAGAEARFFMGGVSQHLIEFEAQSTVEGN